MTERRERLIRWARTQLTCPDHASIAAELLLEFGAGPVDTADTLPPVDLLDPNVASLFDILDAADLSPMDERVEPRPFTYSPIAILLHHTATGGSEDMPTLGLLKKGMPRLPAPISQLLIGRSGSIAVVSDGYSNHAGGGRKKVLVALQASRALVRDDIAHKDDGAKGNRWLIGIEVENNGVGEVYKLECLRSMQRTCAAICKAFGWSADKVIGHKEWSSRKVDPRYNLDEQRDEIARLIAK